VYYVLTAITLLAAAALAVWLFGPWSRSPEPNTAPTEPSPATARGDTP
jgi:hypothetical protein